MKEKDLIELGFQRVDENDDDFGEELAGPRHSYDYRLPDGGCFMSPYNIFLKTDEWGVWLDDACDTLITDLEDLKTMIRILEKYAKQDNTHLYI